MRTILSRALAELNARRSVMLVTIVAEQGSAPRGPGSQMLVGADGQLTGTIGGGQVERQSELLALSLLKERRSQMQHFALTQAGADSLGMACGGDVTVLFQFISPEDTLWQSVLETALAQLTAAQPGWLILRTDGSAPALLDGEGMALLGSSGTAPLSKRCVLTETDFSLPLPIGERAVIFGAGHIARALVPLLRSVEFRPVVYDDRPALADPAAFPDAERVVCGDFRNIAGTLPLSPEDYVVVMTDFAAGTGLRRRHRLPGQNRRRQRPAPGGRYLRGKAPHCPHPCGNAYQGRDPGGDRREHHRGNDL